MGQKFPSTNRSVEELLDEDGIKTYQSPVGSLLYLRFQGQQMGHRVRDSRVVPCHKQDIQGTPSQGQARPEVPQGSRPQLDITYRSGRFKILAWADASFAIGSSSEVNERLPVHACWRTHQLARSNAIAHRTKHS